MDADGAFLAVSALTGFEEELGGTGRLIDLWEV